MFDTIIIGGGPAAVSAGVYASRKKMKVMVVTESFGGQSIVAASIENWIGTISISGFELAQQLEKHLRAQEGIEIKTSIRVRNVRETNEGFEVETNDDERFETKTVIVCTGGRDRHLGIPGEEKFAGKGVAYCSTCDAPLYKDKEVVVVGGGNAGLEAVVDLEPYAKKITLLIREENPVGDPATFEEIKKIEKASILTGTEITEVLGDQTVTGIKYKDLQTGEEKTLDTQGVFVEVGVVPNSEMVKDLVELSDRGEIAIKDHQTMETSKKGIFAAGDVAEGKYKQNNIAAGDAVKATLSAHSYLLDLRKNG